MNLDTRLNEVIEELVAGGISLEVASEAFSRRYVAAAIRSQGTITKAAAHLGCHRNTVMNRLPRELRQGLKRGRR